MHSEHIEVFVGDSQLRPWSPSNVAEVLEMIGILGRDPRWLRTPVTPAELAAAVSKSNRLATRNVYEEGYQGGASGNW